MVDQLMPVPDSDDPIQNPLLRKAAQVQRLPDGPAVMHAQAEHQHQNQRPADQRHPLTGKAVPDDEAEHHHEYGNCQNLFHDSSSLSFEITP